MRCLFYILSRPTGIIPVSAEHSDSVSSFKCIPNTTGKYRVRELKSRIDVQMEGDIRVKTNN